MTEKIISPGLIGKDIDYSLSPLIHNQSLKLLGLRKPNYSICSFEQSKDIDFFLVEAWRNQEIYGFNVTQPYKNYVASLVGSTSPINTLYRDTEKDFWVGTSTDPKGFLGALEGRGFSLMDFDAVIFIGNGGAVQSIVEFLDTLHSSVGKIPIAIVSRTVKSWMSEFNHIPFTEKGIQSWFQVHSSFRSVLLVQGSSAEQSGASILANLFDVSLWSNRVKLYFDLSYAREFPLFVKCKNEGINVMNGLEMLVLQAIESQKIWWKVSAEFQDIFRFLQNK